MRSIFAVLFGFIVMILSKVLLTLILIKILGLHPDETAPAYLVLYLVFTSLAALIGGAVTASIAVADPIRYASVLALIVFALSLVPFLRYSSPQHLWYRLLMLAAAPIATLAGAALFARNAPATTR